MPLSTPLPRVSLFLESLRVSLAVGALLDLGIAVSLVLLPQPASHLLGLPLAGARAVSGVVAALLLGNVGLGALAVIDPMSYRGNALTAAIVRWGRAAALGLFALGDGAGIGVGPLAAIDGVLGTVHAIGWWRSLR